MDKFRAHPILVVALAAMGIGVLPFWWAMGVLAALVGYAICECVLWYRAYRSHEDIREFIQHELDKMPAREQPARADVLRAVSHYPRAWQPFVREASSARAAAGTLIPFEPFGITDMPPRRKAGFISSDAEQTTLSVGPGMVVRHGGR